MSYNMKRSGAYIQNLRIQSGYTQHDLAKVMNIDQSFLSRIESGTKGCSVDIFIQFAEIFHVSLDALILGTDVNVPRRAASNATLKADIGRLIEQLTQLQDQL